MRVLGLTGGIGTGKSTVARFFRDEGIPVVDADRIAREVTEPGQEAYREILLRFGREVLLPDGRIDRKRLGETVFSDPGKRAELESVTHPRITEGIAQALSALEREGHPVAVVEAALIHERRRGGMFEAVIGVWCDRERQVERIMGRDGVSRGQAIARIAAQMDPEEKTNASEYRIDNSGDPESTREQVRALARKLLSP